MSLPNVVINVQDGALGSLPASTANVGAHLGVCQSGAAAKQASLSIASTTGGDGVLWTAVTPGAAGNLITITYASPSGGSTTVSVVGNAITISPMTSETNTGVVAAVAASSAASALISGSATGGSDHVIAASSAPLTGGVTGVVYTFSDPQTALNTLGQGPLTESVCHSLAIAGGTVMAVAVNASVAGSTGSWTHVGAGAGAVSTSSGTPRDGYQIVVKIVAAGNLGVATFQYSLDNGNTFSGVVATASTFALGSTGVVLGFTSAAYVAGDTYSATCTAPSYSGTDVTNAFNALTANPNTWGFAHLVGNQSSVSADATMATLVNTLMDSAASTLYRYAFAIVETGPDTDANITTAYASTVCDRTMVTAGQCTVASPISGNFYNRNVGVPAAARNALIVPSEDMGYVARGALPGVKSISRDENTSNDLDALGFTTVRTITGLPGFYFTSGHMFVAQTSDYYLSQNRRVMDQACIATRVGLLNFLNGSLRVTATTGAIYPQDASKIENTVQSLLNATILAPGWCSGTSVVVNRTNNILSTKQLLVNTRVTPLGYAKQIVETIAFFNPALASATT